MKKFFLFLFLISTLSCSKSVKEEEVFFDMCPHCTIYLQPYEDFTKKEVLKLIPDLEEYFHYWVYGEWFFEVLDPIPLPKESYIEGFNKYEAITILNSQKKKLKNNYEMIIGLTHKDICKDIHNTKHYGIVGLSYCPGNTCVVSDKRLKDKSIIWKPMLHEFLHAFYGEHHCPNNDPTCFMVDAKGKGNFKIQNKLCNMCRR